MQAHPRRAAFRSRVALEPFSRTFDAVYFTTDDGATWTPSETGVLPYALVFDPSRPGCVVGLTRPFPEAYGSEFVHESLDAGRTCWTARPS